MYLPEEHSEIMTMQIQRNSHQIRHMLNLLLGAVILWAGCGSNHPEEIEYGEYRAMGEAQQTLIQQQLGKQQTNDLEVAVSHYTVMDSSELNQMSLEELIERGENMRTED
jgi:hypothetical protein